MNALRNLGLTNTDFGKSINKLSTGLRINSAADDPAGLIMSENFRSQIAGLEQARRNSQDAINFAKTAEGALDEVSRLLRDARSLAVASANSAILSAGQLQANQNQLDGMMSSITRISQQTQFGKKNLLDGSSGVNASLTNSTNLSAITLSGMLGGASVVENSSVDINVTTAATQATTTGTATYAASTSTVSAGSFSINGVTFNTTSTQTIQQVVDQVNQASGQTGVAAVLDGSNAVVLTTTAFGANASIDVTDATGIVLSAAGAVSAAGTNAVATVTAPVAGQGATALSATFTGGQAGADGLTLSDGEGNVVKLTIAGNVTGTVTGVAQVRVGSAQFQIGANAGQTAMLSIGNFSASNLGVDNLDLTSTSGANATLAALDAAIESVTRSRGEIGSFHRNILESNVRSLGVAKENMSATESTIRDTDIAEEMTNYTKLQILQQAGMSVLAQANAAPQSVLSLLRG
jgi:flagellin